MLNNAKICEKSSYIGFKRLWELFGYFVMTSHPPYTIEKRLVVPEDGSFYALTEFKMKEGNKAKLEKKTEKKKELIVMFKRRQNLHCQMVL